MDSTINMNDQQRMTPSAVRSGDRAMQRLMRIYLKPQWRLLSVGLLASVGNAGVQSLLAFIVGDTLKALQDGDTRGVNLTCLLIPIMYILKWGFSYYQNVCFAEVAQRVTLNIRRDIYAHLQTLSLSYFDNQQTGNLMSVINNDVPVINNGIMAAKDIIASPILAIVGIVVILRISWQLSLLTFVLFPLMAVALNYLSRTLRGISQETQDQLGKVNTLTEETLAGAKLVRSFVTEERETKRFYEESLEAKRITMTGIRRSVMLAPTVDVIGAVGISAALWFGGRQVVARTLSFKYLAVFVLMLNQIRTGVSGIGNLLASFRVMQGAADRVFSSVLDKETAVVEKPGAIVLPPVKGQVCFNNVDFEYIQARPVLCDITFTMNPGEVVALVGESGSGKSTLSDLIPRFYDPTSGTIQIDGHDIRELTLESLRKQIGIVDQSTTLFGGTVHENIAYGMPDATMEQIETAARHANALEFIARMPKGFDTIVGQRGIQLSGGQRQRLAIARALLIDPRILILDEATSSLDTASEVLVQEALDTLMRGRTTLVIAHRLSTIVNANRILVMEAGRIIERGTHSELLAAGGKYAALCESQFRSNSSGDAE